MTTPAVHHTVGGRGPDPEEQHRIRTQPHGHTVTVETILRSDFTGPGTPREAFDSRRKRLREGRCEHTANPKALTITYTVRNETVTLTYAPLEGTTK